ncbi:MAG: flippase [Candidatus Omnitrophica bacterium]|nr:flippase [Candidatus Omnitrophota bacterium]MDD5671898.1 flippase [Candidatus Omnitrophota bacterium]
MASIIKLIKKTYKMAEHHERTVVLNNFASLSVLQAITYLLPIIILPYLFRVIGPEKFGLISFAQAFVQYFMILTDYGFSISATKEISLCQHEHAKVCRIFSSVMTVKLVLALLSLIMLGAVVYFIPKFRNDWLVYVFSFGAVIGNTIFPVWFFQGKEKMKHISDLNILGGILFAFLIFLFVQGSQDYLMVPLINSSVFLITGLLGQYVVFKKFGVSFRFPGYTSLHQQLKAGWDIFISIVAINAYTTTRIFAIGLLTNNTITGFYSIAEKIAGLCQTFPLTSFSQALFPRLSKIYHKSKLRAFEFMQKIQQITINISLICLPLIFIFSRVIVRILCGGDYPETVLSLRLLLISVLVISSNAFRIQFLLVCGKTHIYSRIHVVMAMFGLPLIFLLITSFSYVGAAVATIIIEIGIFVITFITVKRLKLS